MADAKAQAIEMGVSLGEESAIDGEYGRFETKSANTSQDDIDMHRLGKKQQMNRHLDSIAVFGLISICEGTWLGAFSNISFYMINGGRAGSIWGYLACGAFTFTVVASLAEMASMAPTSGGQYHWVSEFAPSSLQKPLSYGSGWLCALGWQSIIALGSQYAGCTILILASTANPGYVPTPWQETLATLAVTFLAFAFNVWGAKRLPMFEGAMLLLNALGFFAVLAPLWVLAPKAPAREVFTSFSNYGGWPSIGTAVIVGQIASATSFIGVDSAAHMSEEVRNASITVPRMMIYTVLVNLVMGFVSLLTMTFAIQDIEEQIVNTTSAFPFLPILAAGVGSNSAAIAMSVPLVILTIGVAVNATAAGSRQAWAFARDNGLPSWLARITIVNSTPLPVHATIFSLVIATICALLNLGGSEVFGSIAGLVDGAVGGTYALSIGCVLWRRVFGQLPPARWSLGRLGIYINTVALVYQVFITIMCFFPVFAQVTATTMNWGSAMLGGATLLCILDYFSRGRKVYQGPACRVVQGL